MKFVLRSSRCATVETSLDIPPLLYRAYASSAASFPSNLSLACPHRTALAMTPLPSSIPRNASNARTCTFKHRIVVFLSSPSRSVWPVWDLKTFLHPAVTWSASLSASTTSPSSNKYWINSSLVSHRSRTAAGGVSRVIADCSRYAFAAKSGLRASLASRGCCVRRVLMMSSEWRGEELK